MCVPLASLPHPMQKRSVFLMQPPFKLALSDDLRQLHGWKVLPVAGQQSNRHGDEPDARNEPANLPYLGTLPVR